MNNIKRGCVVTWLQKWPNGDKQVLLGTVTSVYPLQNVATVHVDGSRAIYMIPLPLLHRAERAVVQLVAERATDDVERECAIAGCRL